MREHSQDMEHTAEVILSSLCVLRLSLLSGLGRTLPFRMRCVDLDIWRLIAYKSVMMPLASR